VVDSFKYLPRSFRERYQSVESPHESIPWTPLRVPIREARFALVTTAGIWNKETDPPFDYEREKREPTWGDPSYRVLGRDIRQEQVGAGHLHLNNDDMLEDVNTVLPIARFVELEQAGEIGSLAPSHYSFMGFQGSPANTDAWSDVYVPEVAARMRAEAVDAVLITPT
jgi:hypothetical protein